MKNPNPGNAPIAENNRILYLIPPIFLWQIVFSTVSLKFFRFGTVEWIWRQMTSGKWIALRKKKPAIKPVAESGIARS